MKMMTMVPMMIVGNCNMGLRAYYVVGREARVEWPSVAVDVP